MDALKAKTQQYQKERQANEARMRQPQNTAVLERAQFLNALFASKSFSWTAVMMDLEKVLPAGVQVTSIEPVITQGRRCEHPAAGERGPRPGGAAGAQPGDVAAISVSAAGERDRRRRRRGSAMAAMPAAGPGAVEFDILSGYNPLPAKRRSGCGEGHGRGRKTRLRSSERAPKLRDRCDNGVVKAPRRRECRDDDCRRRRQRTAVARSSGRRRRGRAAALLLNLHIAGVVLLGLVNLYLLVQMAFAWHAANSQNAHALAEQTVAMKTAEIASTAAGGAG